MAIERHERSPLLQQNGRDEEDGRDYEEEGEEIVVQFSEGDEEDPRNWPRARKMVNVGIIALMAGRPYFGNL